MNTTDKIVTALTPGSIFNRNGHVFRSIATLAEFADMDQDEVLGLLNGDMAALVTCKPSKKGKGILVALTDQIPQQEEDGPVVVAAGPVAPALEAEEEVAAEAPLDDAPADDAEEVVA